MAFKLSKEETIQRDDLVAKLEAVRSEVDAAVIAANEALQELLLPVNAKIAAYNEILAQAKEFAEKVASRLQEEFDDKSEKWQESDKGTAVNDMISAWNDLDFEEVDEVTIDPIEDIDLAHRDELENASDDVG